MASATVIRGCVLEGFRTAGFFFEIFVAGMTDVG